MAMGGGVIRQEVRIQAKAGQTCSTADEKVARHGEQIDENDIDIAIVVSRIRHTVGAIVVEPPHVDIGVGLLENFAIEPGELSQCTGCSGQVGRRRQARGVTLRQDLATHA